MFSKKDVLRNFTKFTGKHLYQSLYCNKVATLLKWRLWYRCFPVNFVKFLRTSFPTEHLWWLLLNQLACKILAQQGTVFKVIIFEQVNMNLSSDRGKNSFVSLQFCFVLFFLFGVFLT